MEVALANPSLNPVNAGPPPPDPRAGGGARAGEESADPPRRARRARDEGGDQRPGRQLVPRTQTALYTSQARRGIAVYQDTAGFGPYRSPPPTAGIDLYV